MELIGPAVIPTGAPVIKVITDTTGLQDSNLRQFVQLWLDAHVDGRGPGKEFLDPLRLRFLLGSLSLLEVEKAPLRFRYRLVGTDIVQRLGIELTGKMLDDHPDGNIRPFLLQGASMVCREAKPVYAYVDTRTMGYDWRLEVVALPLFSPNGDVAFIGAGQSFPPYKSERPADQRDS